MSTWLRQSTAVDVMVGPELDSVDGNTVEGGLTITQPDVRLSKNGGAFAQKSAAQTLTHAENGWYPANLSTTDTSTLGSLLIVVHESGALQAWREFMIVNQQAWDSLFGSDVLQVDMTQILGDGQSATDLKDFADAGYDPSTNKVEGVKIADLLTALQAGSIVAATMAADMNSYTTRSWLAKQSTTADKYIVQWVKNGQILTSGITLPKIRVFDEDGTDLIAETAMTEIGSTQSFKFEEATDVLTAGEIYMVEAKATIDGSVRIDRQPVMRDSA